MRERESGNDKRMKEANTSKKKSRLIRVLRTEQANRFVDYCCCCL